MHVVHSRILLAFRVTEQFEEIGLPKLIAPTRGTAPELNPSLAQLLLNVGTESRVRALED
jgi:hypothetical protein